MREVQDDPDFAFASPQAPRQFFRERLARLGQRRVEDIEPHDDVGAALDRLAWAKQRRRQFASLSTNRATERNRGGQQNEEGR